MAATFSVPARAPRSMTALMILAGILMLLQPISLDLFTYSFVTILTGTVMFTSVTKFPD